jgi:ATP adenylyltransferase
MGNPLWAPWRMEYILAPKNRAVSDGAASGPKPRAAEGGAEACIFCGIDALSPDELRDRGVVCTTEHAFVVLNRYPFAAGHLLIVPYAHASNLEDLDPEVHDHLFRLVRESAARLRRAVKAEGLNIGVNLGAVAGAGVAAHLHVHIVPRWSGDTNFMPVLADTRVMPQALSATREHLVPYFEDLPGRVGGPSRGLDP